MRLQLLAWGDLLRRYGDVFGQAWKHRAEMMPKKRLPHEAQFLPAALSLQETPVSPAPRVAACLLMTFAVIAVLWASVGKVDIVATARGKMVPNDRVKTIQSLEAATVTAIHVTEGQSVQASDVLIELDATAAQADRRRVLDELADARLQVARAQAILNMLETGRVPVVARPEGISDTRYQEAKRLAGGQMGEFSASLARADAQVARHRAELQTTETLVRKLEQTVPIAQKRAQDFENLVRQNFVSRHGQLEHEQVRIEQESDLASLRSRTQELQAALLEAQSRRTELRAEMRRATLDRISEGHQRVAALEQELLKADARMQRMRLIAPVDGTVEQLAVHTVGGVVTPAQPLMVIVPRDEALEVEAFIENKDIGFIKPNQTVEVKVEAFQFTKYGTVPGRVMSVSNDAISDERRGLIYSMRVQLDRSSVAVDGAPVQLSPGMAVSVEVKTGKRRLVEYFLSPLIQHTHESMRER